MNRAKLPYAGTVDCKTPDLVDGKFYPCVLKAVSIYRNVPCCADHAIEAILAGEKVTGLPEAPESLKIMMEGRDET